jgi:acyl dehydratase
MTKGLRVSKTVVSFETLLTMEGHDLGLTEYRTITQEQINLFAEATDDHQWIHVDTQRAAQGPYGSTIAHGLYRFYRFYR